MKKNTEWRDEPITVTLRSVTDPPIYVKINDWKYEHSAEDSPEEFAEHTKHFYEESTCPINWTSDIVQIKVGDDDDPHGIFEFVSVEDGHFESDSMKRWRENKEKGNPK